MHKGDVCRRSGLPKTLANPIHPQPHTRTLRRTQDGWCVHNGTPFTSRACLQRAARVSPLPAMACRFWAGACALGRQTLFPARLGALRTHVALFSPPLALCVRLCASEKGSCGLATYPRTRPSPAHECTQPRVNVESFGCSSLLPEGGAAWSAIEAEDRKAAAVAVSASARASAAPLPSCCSFVCARCVRGMCCIRALAR